MNITQGPAITKFSALFAIPAEDVIEWVAAYVNRPESEFPYLVERGLVEKTDEERFRSIAAYIKARIADSADARIRESISEDKRKAA